MIFMFKSIVCYIVLSIKIGKGVQKVDKVDRVDKVDKVWVLYMGLKRKFHRKNFRISSYL